MTPPPPSAGAATAGRLRPRPAPRVPRRVSGPGRRPSPAPPATIRPSLPAVLRRLPDAPVLDRLLRGRAWIALVAVGLIGIVFMQVSLLKLNAGISQDVAAADTLERQNAQLSAEVAGLDGEGRLQEAAGRDGLIQPPAGDVVYLDARNADPAVAGARLTAPDPEKVAAVATAWRQALAAGLVEAGDVAAAQQQATQAAPQQQAVAPQQQVAQPQQGVAQQAQQPVAQAQQPAQPQQQVPQPQQQLAQAQQQVVQPQQQAATVASAARAASGAG